MTMKAAEEPTQDSEMERIQTYVDDRRELVLADSERALRIPRSDIIRLRDDMGTLVLCMLCSYFSETKRGDDGKALHRFKNLVFSFAVTLWGKRIRDRDRRVN